MIELSFTVPRGARDDSFDLIKSINKEDLYSEELILPLPIGAFVQRRVLYQPNAFPLWPFVKIIIIK